MNSSRETTTVDSEANAAIATQATFTRLFLKHERELARFARRLCGGDEDRAQDFAQEALVCAYQACLRGRYHEQGNAKAWLLRIVTNLYINDYHRRRRWEADIGLESEMVHARIADTSVLGARANTPVEILMAVTLDEAVEAALAALPIKLLQCAVLVDLQGLDYAQAAKTLGIPIGTVRSRLSRSRLVLRTLLADHARERRYGATPMPAFRAAGKT